MDVRIWALLAVVLFIGGFASFTGYFAKVDTAQHELAQAQAELKELEEELAEDTSDEDGISESASINELVAKYETLEAQKKSLVEAVLTMEGQKEASRKAFRDTVVDVRAKSVGIPWTDVPFRNGQILREVRIQKVTETEITLAHSEGVAKLRPEEIPNELKDRFRIGMEPFLSSPEPVVAAVMPQASAMKESASSKNAKASGASAADSDAMLRAVASLEADVASLNSRLEATESSWIQWRNRASYLRDQAARAKVAGRPTYNLLQEATDAEQKAIVLNQQLAGMREANTDLRKKLTTARVQAARSKSSSKR